MLGRRNNRSYPWRNLEGYAERFTFEPKSIWDLSKDLSKQAKRSTLFVKDGSEKVELSPSNLRETETEGTDRKSCNPDTFWRINEMAW